MNRVGAKGAKEEKEKKFVFFLSVSGTGILLVNLWNYLIVFSLYQWHRHLACEFRELLDHTNFGLNTSFFSRPRPTTLREG